MKSGLLHFKSFLYLFSGSPSLKSKVNVRSSSMDDLLFGRSFIVTGVTKTEKVG